MTKEEKKDCSCENESVCPLKEKGVYPFIVYVNNTFPKQPSKGEDVALEVKYAYVPLRGGEILSVKGIKKGGKISKGEPTTYERLHSIYPGQRIAFSLYWPEETLTISISKPKKIKEKTYCPYYIWAGSNARCYFLNGDGRSIPLEELKSQKTGEDDKKKFIFLPSAAGTGRDDGNDKGSGNKKVFYRGGTLKVLDKNFPLRLLIKKLIEDPVEDDVTIGSGPPA